MAIKEFEVGSVTAFPPAIRFSHSLAFSKYLSDLGIPSDRYLRQAGLPSFCEDPEAIVSVDRMWSFFHLVASGEDPLVGFRVGEKVAYKGLSPSLSRRLESAPTLFRSLQHFTSLIHTEASDLQLGIIERRSDILFCFRYFDRRRFQGYEVSQAYQLQVYLGLVRFFLGSDWFPEEIGLECSQPSALLEELFPKSKLLGEKQFGYFSIPKSGLYKKAVMRAANSNVEVGNFDCPMLDRQDYIERLRSLLCPYLSEGYLKQAFAAELMETSVRTLTRVLSNFGLRYGELVDNLRVEVAMELLANPDLKIIDIAHEVGFSDHGDFSRMFCRATGAPPSVVRRSLVG